MEMAAACQLQRLCSVGRYFKTREIILRAKPDPSSRSSAFVDLAQALDGASWQGVREAK